MGYLQRIIHDARRGRDLVTRQEITATKSAAMAASVQSLLPDCAEEAAGDGDMNAGAEPAAGRPRLPQKREERDAPSREAFMGQPVDLSAREHEVFTSSPGEPAEVSPPSARHGSIRTDVASKAREVQVEAMVFLEATGLSASGNTGVEGLPAFDQDVGDGQSFPVQRGGHARQKASARSDTGTGGSDSAWRHPESSLLSFAASAVSPPLQAAQTGLWLEGNLPRRTEEPQASIHPETLAAALLRDAAPRMPSPASLQQAGQAIFEPAAIVDAAFSDTCDVDQQNKGPDKGEAPPLPGHVAQPKALAGKPPPSASSAPLDPSTPDPVRQPVGLMPVSDGMHAHAQAALQGKPENRFLPSEFLAPPERPSKPDPPLVPQVVIGSIEVRVESTRQPAEAAAPLPAFTRDAGRYYRRRL